MRNLDLVREAYAGGLNKLVALRPWRAWNSVQRFKVPSMITTTIIKQDEAEDVEAGYPTLPTT
jgi:hypothetical protein